MTNEARRERAIDSLKSAIHFLERAHANCAHAQRDVSALGRESFVLSEIKQLIDVAADMLATKAEEWEAAPSVPIDE